MTEGGEKDKPYNGVMVLWVYYVYVEEDNRRKRVFRKLFGEEENKDVVELDFELK
jgi:hypothetical protein